MLGIKEADVARLPCTLESILTVLEAHHFKNPKNTFLTKADTAYDFLRVGKTISNLSNAKKSDNRDEPDVMVVPFGGEKEKKHLQKGLKKAGYKTQDADKDGDDGHVDETKEAPRGTYFTKSGNLVKGPLSKAAKERGARETDPKDSQRSKVPPVTQVNEEESDIDFQLPTGKKMVLQAEDEKHTRGLVVTSNEDGSYDTYYWYEDPNDPMPIEVKIDGETVSKDAKNVRWEYHPELEEARGSCWRGYQQKGYKKKGNKMVPNCVKEEAAGVGIVTKQNATKYVPE